MADDFVIDVRQIGQYPPRTNTAGTYWVGPNDFVLLQINGIGGPYRYTFTSTLVATAGENADTGFAWGVTPPASTWPASIFTGFLSLPLDNAGMILFNAYVDGNYVTRNLNGGWAAAFAVDTDGEWNFKNWLPASADEPLTDDTATYPLSILPNGYLETPDTMLVARDPAIPLEVATKHYVDRGDDRLQDEIEHLFDRNIAIGGSLTVAGSGRFGGCLQADGASFAGNVVAGGNLNAAGNFSSGGSGTLAGDLAIGGLLSAKGANLKGNVKLDNLDISGQLQVSDLSAFARDVLVGRSMDVCGHVFAGSLAVGGASCFNGRVGMERDLGVLGRLDVLGAIAANGEISTHGERVATEEFVRDELREGGVDVRREIEALRYQIEGEITDIVDDTRNWVSSIYAPLHSPNFTGMPTGPTAERGSTDDKLATTAFVMAEIEHHTAGVASWNERTGHVHLELTDIIGAGGAGIHSPHFTGFPEAETAPPGTDSRIIASTEFVKHAIDASRETSVLSFNERVGHVALMWGDVADVGGAPIRNPEFLGGARSPTAEPESNDTNIANTEFVHRAVEKVDEELKDQIADVWNDLRNNTVRSWNQRKGNVVFRVSDLSAIGGALLDSPHFVGLPTAPTAPPDTNTDQLATCRYVDGAIASNPGPPGIQGPKGDIGKTGESWRILGTVERQDQLPEHGNEIGDVWMVDESGDGFVWDGHRWKPIGHIRGARGEQGEQGDPGAMGSVQFTQPSPGVLGQLWLSPAGDGYAYDGTQWLKVGMGRAPTPGLWCGQGGAWVNLQSDPAIIGALPYLKLTGGTVTGEVRINVNAGAGTGGIYLQENPSAPWQLYGDDDSFYVVKAENDNPLVIRRSDSYVTLAGGLWVEGQFNCAQEMITANRGNNVLAFGGEQGASAFIVTAINTSFSGYNFNISGAFRVLDLPEDDPHSEGQFWNDEGTVKVSAG